jgi:hypothetical protein
LGVSRGECMTCARLGACNLTSPERLSMPLAFEVCDLWKEEKLATIAARKEVLRRFGDAAERILIGPTEEEI